MRLPTNILVPTDFSKSAEAALDYAVALAGRLDARVHVLSVVGFPLVGAETGATIPATMIEEVFEHNQKELDRLVAARADKCAFGPTLLESGDTRAQIEVAAAQVKADLIVMGTHGRQGFSRLFLGSVAESVARVAPCPVLLVREQ